MDLKPPSAVNVIYGEKSVLERLLVTKFRDFPIRNSYFKSILIVETSQTVITMKEVRAK